MYMHESFGYPLLHLYGPFVVAENLVSWYRYHGRCAYCLTRSTVLTGPAPWCVGCGGRGAMQTNRKPVGKVRQVKKNVTWESPGTPVVKTLQAHCRQLDSASGLGRGLRASELLLFSCPVAFDRLRPHGLQHTWHPFPSASPRLCPSSSPVHR